MSEQKMDLHSFRKAATDLLQRAVGEGRGAFRQCSMATIGPDGPAVRTVILRKAQEDGFSLAIHSDARSRKADHLADDASVALLFWDEGGKTQLRCRGTARLFGQGSEEAAEAWSTLHDGQKRQYLTMPAPGETIDGPDAYDDGSAADGEPVPAGFCIIRVDVRQMEILSLSGDKHHRARYERSANGTVEGCWVAP